MKSLALTAIAAAVLATGLVGAAAQSDHDGARKGHHAQSVPSAQGTIQSHERATTGAGSEQDRPASSRDQDSDRDNRTQQQSGSEQKLSEQPAASDAAKASKQSHLHGKTDDAQRAAKSRSRGGRRQAGNRGEQNGRRHENNRAPEPSKSSSRESRREHHSRSERNRRAEQNLHEMTGKASGVTVRHRNAVSEHGSRHDHIKLSEHQRTRLSSTLSERIDRLDIRPITRTRISVSVGRRVPRSIRLYNLPRDVVRIYPRFRGDRFVLVENEIVVVDPDTRHIVAVLPRSESRHAARQTTGVGRSEERLELTPEQRRVIRATVIEQPTCHYEQRLDFFLFMPVPHTVQVCEFPRQVVQEVPEIEQYRYVVHNHEVVVVEPNQDRVVEVIK